MTATKLSRTYPFTVTFTRTVLGVEVADSAGFGSRELAEQALTTPGWKVARVVCSECGREDCRGFYKPDANHGLAF